MSQDDVERVARAIYPLFAGFVTGRAPVYDYEDTLEDNREAARDLARAALSAMPPRELLAEALEAFDFVIETRSCVHGIAEDQSTFDYYAKSCPICRARAAADKIRAALTQEKQP